MFCTLDATIIPIIFNHYQITLVTVHIQRVVPEYVHAPPPPISYFCCAIHQTDTRVCPIRFSHHLQPYKILHVCTPTTAQKLKCLKTQWQPSCVLFHFFIALLMITCQINIHSPLYVHNMEAGILLSMRWRVHLTTVTTRRDTVKKLIYFTWRNIKWVSLYLIKTWLNFMSNYLGQNNSNSEYKCMTDVE